MANKYSNIDLSKYSNGYKKPKEVLQADAMKRSSEIALKNHGDFNYKNQGMYDEVLNSLLNRKAFSYDMNADALYQQYKDQYQALGKLAMEDTMGQAAAMTGGYGNSYAVSAGSQAYQSYLDKANEMLPEFYGMALDTYNAEGDRLAKNFGVISSDRNTAYGEHMDEYNKLVADRDYYANEYNNAYNRDYSEWVDNRNFDQSQYWNEYNAGYQADRDAVADTQVDRQMKFNEEQFAYEKEQKSSDSNKTYAITDYAKVPDDMRKNIEAVRESAYDYNEAKMPIQWYAQKNPEVFNKKVADYLDSLVAAGKISPAVADLLMEEYAV